MYLKNWFYQKNHAMTIEIQLPFDKKEATFVLELLKKLNLIYTPQDEAKIVVSEELQSLLKERILDMETHPDDVISWDAIQKRDKLQIA